MPNKPKRWPITVVMTKVLGDIWADPDIDDLDDGQLLEMLLEDISDLIDGAGWTIQRTIDDCLTFETLLEAVMDTSSGVKEEDNDR